MLEQVLNRYWKTVASTIRDGIMIVDKHGVIVSVNDAMESISGFSSEELIGSTCSVLKCDICEQVRENGEHWCGLFRTGELTRRKCAFISKDLQTVHAMKNAALIHDENGQVIGAVETITDITELLEKDHQIEAYQRELLSENGFRGIIGKSASMQQVFDLIENAALSEAPVIILGESGTGKELVSRAIHDLSPRKSAPFIKVNCAALTDYLLESELFGHVKGAYTGAHRNRLGRFETANGGNIFLDEIGDLPLATQVKLLRVLEEKVVERVGHNTAIPVDVRIISATNQNLQTLVSEGRMREDFFFRINVIPIQLPPLRDRVEDIPLLAESFFRKIRLKNEKQIAGISSDAMIALMSYDWPGNVRELLSAFEFAFVTCNEPLIQPNHLPPVVRTGSRPENGQQKIDQNCKDTLKREELIRVLEQTRGNQSETARIMGISRVTVWNRMKKYGIVAKKSYVGTHR
jgi:two-component system response regulator HydG